MSEFSLFINDPLYRILSKINLVKADGLLKSFPTIVLAISITWIPVAILAGYENIAITPDCIELFPDNCKTSFLVDFAAYAQFLLAIPFFIGSERYIESEITFGLEHFFHSGIIERNNITKLREILKTATKIQSNTYVFLFLFILAHILTWGWAGDEITNNYTTWHAVYNGENENFTLAGYWHVFISLPIVLFGFIRWAWKISIWYWVLWKISRIELKINACHPDHFGGLGFLANLQSKFGGLLFAMGGFISATIGYKVLIENADLISIPGIGVILAYVILAPLFFLIPLFFFRSHLLKAKRKELLNYSRLTNHHTAKAERLLNDSIDNINSNSDNIKDAIRELSDLKAFYENARSMYTMPLDFQHTRRLFASALGPMLPFLTPTLRAIVSFVIGFDI